MNQDVEIASHGAYQLGYLCPTIKCSRNHSSAFIVIVYKAKL